MTTPDDLEALSYLWDGSQPGWAFRWRHHVVCTVTIHLEGPPSTPSEVSRIRKLVPEFGAISAAEAYRALAGRTSIQYPGELGHIEKRWVLERAARLGFRTSTESRDLSGGLPFRDGFVLLIEDQELARRVCEKMREAGCPILLEEVD